MAALVPISPLTTALPEGGLAHAAVLVRAEPSWSSSGTAARPRVPPGPTVAAAVDGGPAPVGEVCAVAEDCASGFCVDGVCCEAACQGQCEACDEPGSPGACVAIQGAPHGDRAECAVTDCAAACDGTRRDACTLFGHSPCFAGRCVDSASFWSVIGILEECAPYRCGDGGCLTACASSDDCGAGFACERDAGMGRCVAVARPAAAEDGGCACGLPARNDGGAGPSAVVAAVAMLGAHRATRRRRAAL